MSKLGFWLTFSLRSLHTSHCKRQVSMEAMLRIDGSLITEEYSSVPKSDILLQHVSCLQ